MMKDPRPDGWRVGCWCEHRAEPCPYHQGWSDGWDSAVTARMVGTQPKKAQKRSEEAR